MTPPDGRDVAEAAVDLEGLERLARAATTGPWTVNDDLVWSPKGLIASAENCGDEMGQEGALANADFIAAANPATVLHLIARARAASPQEHDQGGGDVVARAIIRDLMDTYPEGYLPSCPLAVRAANFLNRTSPTPATAGEPSPSLKWSVALIVRRAIERAKSVAACKLADEAADAILALRTAPASSLEGGGEQYVVPLRLLPWQADMAGMPAEWFERAVRRVGRPCAPPLAPHQPEGGDNGRG